MLILTVGATDVFDDESQTFGAQGGFELQLEHSLASLSKWESKHEKPFLGAAQKTPEEILSYIDCMVIGEKPPGNFLEKLSNENLQAINAHIDAKMSATWFSDRPNSPRTSETITSELIYYWMTVFKIDWGAQHWHLNRLFTLIRIANLKQQKPKKMSRSEVARRNRELNAQRKAELGTTG